MVCDDILFEMKFFVIIVLYFNKNVNINFKAIRFVWQYKILSVLSYCLYSYLCSN